MNDAHHVEPVIRIGASACLAGERVRYDGTDRRDRHLLEELPGCFERVPVCPETAIGLGVPRAPIRLQREAGQIRLRGIDEPAADHTGAMLNLADHMARTLSDVCGFVFKARSPSCAVDDALLLQDDGSEVRHAGLFNQALRQRLPLLPVIDENGLADQTSRERFIERVVLLYRWRQVSDAGMNAARLQAFHCAHRHRLLAYDEYSCLMLDDLVAQTGDDDIAAQAGIYIGRFMAALEGATKCDHARVFRELLAALPGTLTPQQDIGIRRSLAALAAGEIDMDEMRARFLALPGAAALPGVQRSFYLYPYLRDFVERDRP